MAGDSEAAQQPHVTLVFAVPACPVTQVEQAVDRVAQKRTGLCRAAPAGSPASHSVSGRSNSDSAPLAAR